MMLTTAFAPLIGPLGFYPVLPDATWIARMLAAGVRTVQLRCKTGSLPPEGIAAEVAAAVQTSRNYPDAQLFINDHWQLALACGAYGIHLGQEDWAALPGDVRDTLRGSGLRLGLSTHTPDELQLALAAAPSYVAIGPVYPTTLKKMPYAPVGLSQLPEWAASAVRPAADGALQKVPVVAIGGISLERLPGVLACGVDGVAVVSAITQAADPDQAARTGLALCRAL